jgi:oligopeptide transport system ATP-binding protein
MSEPVLSVRDLTVSFDTDRGALRAVDSVSFDVAAGETLALVGESGSGKSVTALSLLRLVPEPPGRIERGEVRFGGEDLLQLDGAAIRRIRGNRIGMIFQEPMSSLNPVLTVGTQVGEPLRVHRGMARAETLEEVTALLTRVRIPDARERLRSYPHQHSGGMRQRVMIAMSLSCRPELIIADEPTTALDVTVQAQILALLERLTDETGAALILITHDLGVVARYADRVAVMYAGRIVETAPAAELYARPRHPYTRGLLASVPRLDAERRRRLQPIQGQPPDLANLPPGCAFAPRCSQATDRCRRERPALEPVCSAPATSAEPGDLPAPASWAKACFADVPI